MNIPKVWLTLMTSTGNEENLRELIDPLIPYIDGVVAVMHNPCEGDLGLAYLEKVKGGGEIIIRDWVQRHDVSASETLYAGVIQEGDLFIIVDTLERAIPSFIARCRDGLNDFMYAQKLDCLVYYGKPYIVRYNEGMHYRGSPHWSLQGVKNAVELSSMYPDERDVRLNVRPIKRKDEPLHWVGHFSKYWLYPEGSNHAAMGLDHWPLGDRNTQFIQREGRRLAFRRLMRERGYPLNMGGLKAMLTAPLDDILKEHLNAEKVLSDIYWFWHGRSAELRDSHRPADAIPIL